MSYIKKNDHAFIKFNNAKHYNIYHSNNIYLQNNIKIFIMPNNSNLSRIIVKFSKKISSSIYDKSLIIQYAYLVLAKTRGLDIVISFF